jgi:hypothetical protein
MKRADHPTTAAGVSAKRLKEQTLREGLVDQLRSVHRSLEDATTAQDALKRAKLKLSAAAFELQIANLDVKLAVDEEGERRAVEAQRKAALGLRQADQEQTFASLEKEVREVEVLLVGSDLPGSLHDMAAADVAASRQFLSELSWDEEREMASITALYPDAGSSSSKRHCHLPRLVH